MRKRESQSVCAGERVHYCELITSVTKQQMHYFFITEGTGHLRTCLVTQVEERDQNKNVKTEDPNIEGKKTKVCRF